MTLLRVDLLADLGAAEALVGRQECYQANSQADSGCAESGMPPVLVPHDCGDEVADERAQVDAEVEDVEAGVLELASLGVESTEHGRDVWLEEAVADDEQAQPEVEHAHALERQADVSGTHDDGTEHDRLAVAEDAVGEDAADEGREVDQGRVGPEDRACLCFVEAQSTLVQAGRHIE